LGCPFTTAFAAMVLLSSLESLKYGGLEIIISKVSVVLENKFPLSVRQSAFSMTKSLVFNE